VETILIVDDEKNYPLILGAVLEEEGFHTLSANSGKEALTTLETNEVDLILTDMKMPVMDGIELLESIKKRQFDCPVIMMTAHGTVEKAVEAMQKGAYTYILKPFDNDDLIVHINKALSMHRVVRENRHLRDVVASRYSFGNIIGKSKAMQNVYETIQKVAPASATVLIEGESGTGKELAAKAIHFNSSRKDKPFIAVNCSAFAETLLESELFGHEKGAFTGAVGMKKGRFELADDGTLFLDEIGELSPALQVKLLRVLQEKTFERVGGTQSISVNFRLLAATNKHLKAEVEKGNFREDLYYRLNVVHIVLPPLRQRQDDIPLLIAHFLEKYAPERELKTPLKGMEPEALRLFFDYSWPGNIRELENVIERATLLSPGEEITVSDLPKNMQGKTRGSLYIEDLPPDANLQETLAIIEKKMIERALKLSDNVQSRAAELLGIGKSGLNQKIKKYKLDGRSKS
jgi:two-component system NtrC family response regulator